MQSFTRSFSQFGSLMAKSFNESYEKGELGKSQKQVVITLLDKGKDRTLLKTGVLYHY